MSAYTDSQIAWLMRQAIGYVAVGQPAKQEYVQDLYAEFVRRGKDRKDDDGTWQEIMAR